MSEIRERAKEWINSKSDRKTITYEHAIIRDLLAELERAENSREAECVECEKLACIEIRQQAARECVEIIDKYPAFLFGTDAVGVKLNLSQDIKAHFKLQEAPK